MDKEKHFFEVHSPEYNILKTPGSPSRGSGWKHSEATIENMRIAALKKFKSPGILDKLSRAQSSCTKVEVTDVEQNSSTIYHAIRAAARALNIDKRYIEHYIYLKQDEPVLGRYTFKLVKSEGESVGRSLLREEQDAVVKVKKVQKTSKKLKVVNVNTNEVTIYHSVTAAARSLGLRQTSISTYLIKNRTNPFKGKYLFKLV